MDTQVRRIFRVGFGLAFGFFLAGLSIGIARQQAALAAGAGLDRYVDALGVCGHKQPCYTHPQYAVNAANDGDIIKIADFTFTQTFQYGGHEQIVYISKTLTLMGGYSQDFTEPSSYMYKPNLMPPAGARAIYIDHNASVTLRYIYFYGADGPAGAVLYADHANLTVKESYFVSNKGVSCSVLWLNDGVLRVEASEFFRNSSSNNNAAICATRAAAGSLISQVQIVENIAGRSTGMDFSDSSITIERSFIKENSALTGTVGGVSVQGGVYTLTNNVFIRNYAAGGSPVMSAENAAVTMLHNTINGDYGPGALIGLSSGSKFLLRNSILLDYDVALAVHDSHLSADHNLFYVFTGNPVTQSGSSVITLTEVYTEDPGLAIPSGFMLMPDSFAEGKAADAGLGIDFQGALRPTGSGPDLGAIEAPLPYVAEADQANSAIFADPLGLTTTVEIPAGAILNDMQFLYTPLDEPGEGFTRTFGYGGRAFVFSPGDLVLPGAKPVYLPLIKSAGPALGALAAPARPQSYIFQQPILVTLDYLEEDLDGLAESDLLLFYFDEQMKQWLDVAESCRPVSTYARDLEANRLSIEICHLSRFGMGGH